MKKKIDIKFRIRKECVSFIETYVCGNGSVKTGGSLTGSLGFGSEAGAGFAAFGSGAGAVFFGAAGNGALDAGFGAVIDGNGGETTDDDDETPIHSNNH